MSSASLTLGDDISFGSGNSIAVAIDNHGNVVCLRLANGSINYFLTSWELVEGKPTIADTGGAHLVDNFGLSDIVSINLDMNDDGDVLAAISTQNPENSNDTTTYFVHGTLGDGRLSWGSAQQFSSGLYIRVALHGKTVVAAYRDWGTTQFGLYLCHGTLDGSSVSGMEPKSYTFASSSSSSNGIGEEINLGVYNPSVALDANGRVLAGWDADMTLDVEHALCLNLYEIDGSSFSNIQKGATSGQAVDLAGSSGAIVMNDDDRFIYPYQSTHTNHFKYYLGHANSKDEVKTDVHEAVDNDTKEGIPQDCSWATSTNAVVIAWKHRHDGDLRLRPAQYVPAS